MPIRRKNVMLAAKFDSKRLAKWPQPYILQPKINGRRALVYFNSAGVPTIKSSEDHVITSLPSLSYALELLDLRSVTLDGELYNPAWSFQRLCSVVGRTNNLHPDQNQVCFYCFDIVVSDTTQEDRLRVLNKLFGLTPSNVVIVNSVRDTDIQGALDYYVSEGFEGVIIRHKDGLYQPLRSTFMMKLKPRLQDSFPVVDWEEEKTQYGEPKNSLGAFWLRAKNGETFKVGTGFTRAQRDEYWQGDPLRLLQCRAEIYYQELSERGVPIFPVFIRLA